MLEHSIVTPSLAAKIMYDKYINAVPINRISKELGWLDAKRKTHTCRRDTADRYGSPPIFIYDYHDNRRGENVENFLKDYHGIVMADGYEPYHAVGTVAFEGNERIAKIYYEDNKKKDASEEERLEFRQEVIKPLVDDFFEWAKEREGKVASERTKKSIKICYKSRKVFKRDSE